MHTGARLLSNDRNRSRLEQQRHAQKTSETETVVRERECVYVCIEFSRRLMTHADEQ